MNTDHIAAQYDLPDGVRRAVERLADADTPGERAAARTALDSLLLDAPRAGIWPRAIAYLRRLGEERLKDAGTLDALLAKTLGGPSAGGEPPKAA